uniref:NFACT-R_1 domain-containing protein n=1 Tax=Globodera pallida TaxID=36090 RepID=A0A183CCC2_GLOPA
MKTKFATFDLCAVLHDLRKFVGMRVVNVYDINSKTYLIKLQRPNEKAFILFESGIRIHITTYDWPKATFPSGFSMKFRKHINTRRLTAVSQVGVDRIVDMQFGDGDRTCHVIVELYDRGNVILTDHNYQILNILRPRTDHDADVRISVRERYPLELARQSINDFMPSSENILLFLQNAQEGEMLRKALVRHVPFGALLIDHAFTVLGIPLNSQVGVNLPASEAGAQLVEDALAEAARVSSEIEQRPFGGFIAYEEEYYPCDFLQFRSPEQPLRVLEFGTFSEAVDKFYSSIETQKAEHRVLGAEREAEKKLENVRRDHGNRIQALAEVQQIQERRAELILLNRELVEKALYFLRIAIANMSWTDIEPWLKAVADEQPVVRQISKLQLDSNRFTMRLGDPENPDGPPLNVDIDIGLNADQNARRFFTERKAATIKQHKTVAASKTAIKSAQKQAKNKVNQMKTKKMSTIRARKSYWFEKFHWFISSDRFLVLAGRDAQQNELLVKRYMRSGDIYVHAEIQGAASVVIRNRDRSGIEPPPRTLNEAGSMAVCFSSAWDAGVSVNAWWVRHDQVSRTAPTGEYIPAGAFMIRGKRNFLPSCQLQLGFAGR